MLIRVKRPASRTVTIGSSATGRASNRRKWTSDIGLTATAPLSRFCDMNASGARMVSECVRDGSPRYWAARGCHRKMWNAAGDILWIVVGGPSGERCFERSAHETAMPSIAIDMKPTARSAGSRAARQRGRGDNSAALHDRDPDKMMNQRYLYVSFVVGAGAPRRGVVGS